MTYKNMPASPDTSAATPEDIAIASGQKIGYSLVNKFGNNPDIDTGSLPEDIWGGGGAYTGFPVGDNEVVTVVSASADDTAAGTGARTVRIIGLDSSGNEQEETVTLNGTSSVDSSNTFTRLNRAIVLTAGSGGVNAGAITIAHKVTTANVFAILPASQNQTEICAYTIPTGKTGFLRYMRVEMNRSNSANAKGFLWVRENGAAERLIRPFSISNETPTVDTIYGGIVLPALTDVTVRITDCSANNTDITANFDIVLKDD